MWSYKDKSAFVYWWDLEIKRHDLFDRGQDERESFACSVPLSQGAARQRATQQIFLVNLFVPVPHSSVGLSCRITWISYEVFCAAAASFNTPLSSDFLKALRGSVTVMGSPYSFVHYVILLKEITQSFLTVCVFIFFIMATCILTTGDESATFTVTTCHAMLMWMYWSLLLPLCKNLSWRWRLWWSRLVRQHTDKF